MQIIEFGEHCFALLRAGLGGDERSLHAFCDLFADAAELWLPPTPNTRSPYRGPAAIRALLCGFVPKLYQGGLQLRLYQLLSSENRVVFQFEDHGKRADGSDYRNSPCIALALRDDQITGFWEYWGGPEFFCDSFDGSGARGQIDTEARDIARNAQKLLISGLSGVRADLDAFIDLLADDVRLWFPPTPNTKSPYIGRGEARRLFCDFLPKMYPNGMRIEAFHETSGGTRTAFELQSYGVRADGSEYINSPCVCFDVKLGKVRTFWEHWGGAGFHHASSSPLYIQ